MIIVVPFFQGDRHLAVELAAWLNEIGTYPTHDLLIVRDHRAAPVPDLGKGFRSVEELVIKDDAYNRWPQSCNVMWQTAAKHIARTKKQPWLWLEVDAVLLKASGLDEIALEYEMALKAGKWFLGDLVTVNSPHMSGVAVYPWDIFEHAGEALLAHELAWDAIGAGQIVPQMQKSELIRHVWKADPFTNWDEIQRRIFDVKPRAVLFHADKAASLIPILRARRNPLPVPVLAETTQRREEERESTTEKSAGAERNSDSRCGQFICDLFLKTFPADYKFAEYCLRSIDKFCYGFRRLILIAPDDRCPRPSSIPYVLALRQEEKNGYNGQQLVKMNADQYSDASHFLFCDSDTIFTRQVTPETYLRDTKPTWLMTLFEKAREDQQKAWIPVMTRWMNKVPEFEFMRRHPFMFPRWLCSEIRIFCETQHGMSLHDYVLNSGEGLSFSEFNNAGFLAYERFRDRFAWINTETDEVPELTTLQHWSRGGLTPEIEAEFETILSGGTEGRATCAKVSEGLGNTPDSPTDTAEVRPEKSHSENQASPAQEFQALPHCPYCNCETHKVPPGTPWANRAESIAEINRLAARLKEFQGNNPVKVRFVRELLQRQGVITLTYRMKKRRGWKRKKK